MFRITCLVFILSIPLLGCHKRKKIEFHLKKLSLNKLEKENYPDQHYYLKVIELHDGANKTLIVSENYPSDVTLPAEYAVNPTLSINFYTNDFAIELWGDSSQLIGTNKINLDDYKIIYPLEMDTEHDEIGIALHGTWK